MSADAFDDALASVADFAVALLTAPPGADRARPAAQKALSAIVVAVAEARARLPGDDEILEDLDRARAAWARAIGDGADEADPLAPLGPALDRARALALERAARAPVRVIDRGSGPSPLVASRGTPALHRDVRIEAAPRPLAPPAFGALPRPRQRRPDETLAAKALRRWARDALEELAAAGRLRRPRDDEAWTSGRSFEERALLSLDALASLGRGASDEERTDVADVIEDTLHDWSIPDPGRVFAATFALACLQGHGAAARLHVHACNLHPTTAGAIEDALALGSSPHIGDVLVALLCDDGSPDLLERALRVARRRGRAPAGLVLPLLSHPEPRVAVAAARACAALEPQVARAPLEEALFGPAEIAVHAAESLALLHAPAAGWASRLVALGSGDLDARTAAHAARLRVHHASARDVDAMLELCAALPREVSVDLLGWLGSARALDALCAALRDDDWAVRERAAWSLARVTGAGRDLLGTIETDEHGHPLHDPDKEPLPDDVDRTRRHPPLDPDFWAEPIARARAVPAPRLRFGRPLGAGVVLDELLDPAAHQGARRVLMTELGVLTAGATPGLAGSDRLPFIDVDDWIARQEKLLGLAREALSPALDVAAPGRSARAARPDAEASSLGGRR